MVQMNKRNHTGDGQTLTVSKGKSLLALVSVREVSNVWLLLWRGHLKNRKDDMLDEYMQASLLFSSQKESKKSAQLYLYVYLKCH